MCRTIGYLFCAVVLCASLADANAADLVDLQCEYTAAPLNVDVASPRLSWKFDCRDRGAGQSAYQVLVASTVENLTADRGDLWDSGKTVSTDGIQIPYAGKPLVSGQKCFWKVRIWNQADQPSAWSQPASWAMGKLAPSEWTAKWITSPVADAPDTSLLGYHAQTTQNADTIKWVQVDLGRSVPIDAVKLHSLDHEVRGFGFPIRFTIKASDDPNFDVAQTIVDHSDNDYPNPGAVAVTFPATGIHGRYVRVTANRLFRRTQGEHPCCFALAELEVFSGAKNVALHAPVTALDSIEGYGWGAAELTDGIGLAPDASAAQRPMGIQSLPIFRKSFPVDKPVRRAAIYICGLGQYELHLNGKKVGDAVLVPGWTNYRKTCLYQAYDVTSQLHAGTDVIGVMLGNGMYRVIDTAGRYNKFTQSFGPLKVIVELDLTYSDGSTDRVGSDSSWLVSGGPITFSSIYGGEDDDARLEKRGWDSEPNLGSEWDHAVETDGPGGALVGSSHSAPPITVAQILNTQKITHPRPGVWVYDLGQNCAMMPAISVTGAAGATIRLTPGEVLFPDGTVSQQPSGGPAFYTYTLKGAGIETWSPRFTYYGSRYIEVTGAVPAGSENFSHLPVINELHGLFITSSSPAVGEFTCSNPLFTNTAKIIRWAMRSNMMSVLTDCPHREKLGWLEETHLVGPSLMYNFEIPALFNKISADTSDSQTSDGLVPDIAPEYPVFNGGFRDSPEWGSACVLIPWQVYQWYGDTHILAARYNTMKRYVDYLTTKSKDGILNYGLGDWYDLGPNPPGYAQLTPVALTATAFYVRDIAIVRDTAHLLGHDDDFAQYTDLERRIRASFNRAFYHVGTHSYATGSQTANAIPLAFGLAPEEDRAAILQKIVDNIRKHHNGLTSGDIGYRYLLRALADGGRSDVIFDMNIRSDRPGYGMMLARGATSLTEAWDGRLESSQDHFMLGHIMEWFYSDLAGIKRDPAGSAYSKIIIQPTPVGDITWVKASYQSVRGLIQSNWKISGGLFDLDIVIPEGCTAQVRFPLGFKPDSDLTARGAATRSVNRSSINVNSGTYHFAARKAVQ